MALPQQYERYTWQDYLSWPEDERWELIQGVAYAMSPAPATGHQRIVGEIYRQISNYLLDKPCEVLVAPFDLKLSSEEDDEQPTVVQPDLAVACRRETVTEQGIIGAPDLCVEVTSPGSVAADRKRKFDLYEKHGVREYWIVESAGAVLEVYRLDTSGRYTRIGAYGAGESLSPQALPELAVDLSLVFRDYSAQEQVGTR